MSSGPWDGFIGWWYPLHEFTKPAHHLAVERVRKWGSPVLLLSWVPVIGDPLCIAAGWLRDGLGACPIVYWDWQRCRYMVLLSCYPPVAGKRRRGLPIAFRKCCWYGWPWLSITAFLINCCPYDQFSRVSNLLWSRHIVNVPFLI